MLFICSCLFASFEIWGFLLKRSWSKFADILIKKCILLLIHWKKVKQPAPPPLLVGGGGGGDGVGWSDYVWMGEAAWGGWVGVTYLYSASLINKLISQHSWSVHISGAVVSRQRVTQTKSPSAQEFTLKETGSRDTVSKKDQTVIVAKCYPFLARDSWITCVCLQLN